jgi:[calcium/calmodulin-dependent protein kinase] kinase
MHRMSSQDRVSKEDADNNSLNLIKEEIAVMKKLNHNNLVSLIEVLDDPEEDSLYMVLELCEKGVVMKVGLDSRAEPYPDETCRCWFRDMILGIEYLHAQGVVHRDIKPDNCLITNDDELKIVDFGVSEMFEKASDMATAKSAGSPAFMPPELCVAKHGTVSGRAADIWSMGVTLFCLRYGHIPFERSGMLELYDSIRADDLTLDDEQDRNFEDLIRRILRKDPEKRITMDEMRVNQTILRSLATSLTLKQAHPWVTKNGTDPLLSAEENCSDLVEPPTEAELHHAITGNMGNLMVVMRAVKRFKALVARKRPRLMSSIFGGDSRIVSPPRKMNARRDQVEIGASRSVDADDRRPVEQALAIEGIHRDIKVDDDMERLPRAMDHLVKLGAPADKAMKCDGPSSSQDHHDQKQDKRPSTHRNEHRHVKRSLTSSAEDYAKGHAHDPLLDTIMLDLGPGSDFAEHHSGNDYPVVSESPPAVEMHIYEQAYQDEMRRIEEAKGEEARMYLNRRVDHRHDIREKSTILDEASAVAGKAVSKFGLLAGAASRETGGLAKLVKEVKLKRDNAAEDEGDAEAADEHNADVNGDTRSEEELPAAREPEGVTDKARSADLVSRLRDQSTPRQSLALDIPGAFPKTPDAEASRPLE